MRLQAVTRSMAAILVLLLSTIAVEGAERCLSVQQARAIYPKDHLSWRAVAGKRCWSTRRSSGKTPLHSQVRRATPPRPAPPPVRTPHNFLLHSAPIFLPAELAPPIWKQLKPDLAEEEINAERLLERLGQPIYSTFAGPAPDVWPVLEDRTPVVLQFMAIFLGTILAMVLLFVAYATGRNKLRI